MTDKDAILILDIIKSKFGGMTLAQFYSLFDIPFRFYNYGGNAPICNGVVRASKEKYAYMTRFGSLVYFKPPSTNLLCLCVDGIRLRVNEGPVHNVKVWTKPIPYNTFLVDEQ